MRTSIPKLSRPERRRLKKLHDITKRPITGAEPKPCYCSMKTILKELLAELRKRYRQAKTIRLIVDNYVIHKSGITKTFLEHNTKFQLLFQPVYHPWVNRMN